MGKFRFYHIREGYVDYLHKIDNRVQLNKGQRRPYVGIVLSINGFDYYVPQFYCIEGVHYGEEVDQPHPGAASLRLLALSGDGGVSP